MRGIDRGSPIPLYYQLQEILKQEIDDGRWKPGELLPSEAEMNSLFKVSRSVTRKALDILEADGQVYRVSGKGTIVAEPKFRYEAIGTAANWGTAVRTTLTLSKFVSVKSAPVGGHVGRLLKLPPGEDVYELAYVQSIEDTPASFTQMILRRDATTDLATGPPTLVEGGPDAIVQLRQQFGLSLTESELSIEATRTNSFEAELLDIRQDSPVFLLATVEIGDLKEPVAFSRSVVRSDHFRFNVRIHHLKPPQSPVVGPAIEPERVWATERDSIGNH